MTKKTSRLRRSLKTRAHLKKLGKIRLCIYRSSQHMYAQIISEDSNSVLAAASTAEAAIKEQLSGNTSNCDAAKIVGKIIAERGVAKGITEVAFDRSGFKYHGRVKSLAESARENGLKF